MTNLLQAINETKAAAFAFAEQSKFTKQQAMAFAILAIHEKGVCIATAVEQVCGKDSLDLINDVPYTTESLKAAVQSSFFA